MAQFLKKTKIIASLGPATWDEDHIFALYKAGVNVLRINFSHADYEKTRQVCQVVERLNHEGKTKLALLGDLKGPEMRLGDYEGTKTYQQGDRFKIVVDKTIALEAQDQFCDYPHLASQAHINDIIKIESGIFDVKVIAKGKDYVEVEALNDSILGQRRHVNLPGKKLQLPALSQQDIKDVEFCIQHDFQYIAMSFVRNADHIQELRKILQKHQAETIGIIAKVENQEGIDHIEEIVRASEGVMVARGDLGVEIDLPLIPFWQQKISELCQKNGKLVIIATQLIESMMSSPSPTRAEVSDIFSAVMQKADALMTSGETAIGHYPIETITMMNNIILQAEKNIAYGYDEFDLVDEDSLETVKKMLVKSAIKTANNLGIRNIILFTRSGRLAKIASSFRPQANIFAFTNNWATFMKLALYFGVKSRFRQYDYYIDALDQALASLIEVEDINQEDKVIVISDIKRGASYHPSMEIISVSEFFGL